MFAKPLRRPVAAASAVGGALLVAGLVAPATAQPVPSAASTVVTAATPSCGYQGVVPTVTRLRLSHYVGRVGQSTTARIHVSAGTGTPTGHVTVKVETRPRDTLHLVNGYASLRFGSHLKPHRTYTVTARYPAQGCFGSSADTVFYTVLRRR